MEYWKKLLKQMKLEYIRETAPGFFELSGGFRMKVKPYSDETANGLAKCIEDFITFQGGYCNRVNTMGTMRKVNGQMVWTRGNSHKGAPDLRAVYRGYSIDIEVKIGRDRMSEAQRKEQQRITAAGGLHLVATDFPAFLQWWQQQGFKITQTIKNKENDNATIRSGY
jgi:hypothetical protein